jgi:Met-zincin/Domain of unknown function (DUF5117)/Domain of unknown function (DUF5118)
VVNKLVDLRKKAWILALSAALVLALQGSPALAINASDVAPCRPGLPQQLRTLKGLFTVHVVCDHVLYEIPLKMLDRDMLLNTEFAALSAGTEKLAPGAAVENRLVRWTRRGNKVYLEAVTYEMRAQNMSNLQRGVEAASLRPVIKAFDAIAEGENGAPVIDVTGLFVSDVPEGFAQEFKTYFQMAANDPKRSYIEAVKVFPRNVEMRYFQTWMADPKALARSYEPGRTPIPASLGFVFHTSMLLLPEKPMIGRYSDPRVGYFDVPFDDYGTPEHRAVRRGYIARYRLEKKHPEQPVSEPVDPIVFYLSPEVPEKWRPWIKKGIEAWQGPLEQAGFKNAIRARDAPTKEEDPDWDPEDVRYSVIRWTPSPRENAMGPSVTDPRSGEVISSHALFWNDVLRLAESWYFVQVSPLDPRAQKLPLPDDLMGQILSYIVCHEIGHALGLRHNFKATSAVGVEQLRSAEWTHHWGTSASIMSYARFNYVAQPGDGAALIPRFGPYDYYAIEWGYKPFGDHITSDEEWPFLDAMAARQIDEPLLRFGGEDALERLDPTEGTNVLGADRVAAADLGLRNVDRVVPLLVSATTPRGKDYRHLAEMYYALVAHRYRMLGAVAKLVGGVEEIRYHGGRGGIPFQPVSPEKQREAVRFLIDRAFVTPTGLLDREVVGRIEPASADDALQGTNVRLLQELLTPGVFSRMVEASAGKRGKQGYYGLDLLEDLNKGLFSELSQAEPVIDPYRRQLQRNYITAMLVANGDVPDPESAGRGFSRDFVDDGGGASWDGESKLNREREQRQATYAYSSLANTGTQFRAAVGRPSEMRGAVNWALVDIGEKIDAALPKVKNPETWAHLRDLRREVNRGH